MRHTWKIAMLVCLLLVMLYVFMRHISDPYVQRLIPAFLRSNEVVYLALVGPFTGADKDSGDAMLLGVQTYLNYANREDLLEGKTIKLLTFNDQNNTQLAMKKAADIVLDSQAVLVLGHHLSETSMAASDSYQKNGIPVITASATEDLITRNNDWYFRVIPNNTFQAEFVVQYVIQALQRDTSSIIYDNDVYGRSLMTHYVSEAEHAGLTIKKIWEFSHENSQLESQLKAIITELRAMRDPGVIFFATHEVEAAHIIASIQFPGTDYTMIGPDTFASPQFIHAFQGYVQEQAKPGYYTNNIYAVSPFLADFAACDANNVQKFLFLLDSHARARQNLSWETASYFDAAMVAVEAIKRAEIHGSDLRRNRRKIRENLADLNNPIVAVPGITGSLYFDRYGDVQRPLSVGIYNKQQLVPAYDQYQVQVRDSSDRTDARNAEGEAEEKRAELRIQGMTLQKTQIVKTGIDINEVSNVDALHSTYRLDFYLWFRFQGEFNDTDIVFPDALTPVTLDRPFFEHTEQDVTVRTYHLKADFRFPFDFSYYPFERLFLPVRFFHANLPTTCMRYVTDTVGLASTVPDKLENHIINKKTGWEVEDIFYVTNEQIASPALSPPQTSGYSQFYAVIRLTRSDVTFVIKNLLPIFALAAILYLSYYIPIERQAIRVLLILSMLLALLIYVLLLQFQFPFQQSVFQLALLMNYVLTAIALGVSLFGYILYKRQSCKMVVFLSVAGKIIHPVLMIVIGMIFAAFYFVLPTIATFTPSP